MSRPPDRAAARRIQFAFTANARIDDPVSGLGALPCVASGLRLRELDA